MSEQRIYNLILDPEFKRLDTLLSSEEKAILGADLIKNGSRPLLVWRKILLSGYSEYEIYHARKIPFTLKEVDIASRPEAVAHMCQIHLASHQGTIEQLRYRVGKFYEAMKLIMIEKYRHQNQYTPDDMKWHQKGFGTKNIAADLLGDKVKITPGTVSKYGMYSIAIDKIAAKCPEIADDILRAVFHLSQNDTIGLSKMSAPEIQVIRDHIVNNRDNRLLQPSLMRTQEREKKKAKLLAEERKITPAIKLRPKYDPDADLSSLTLTIPMWISSINRAIEITDFSNASTSALWKLEQTLFNLTESIEKIRKRIEERYHE